MHCALPTERIRGSIKEREREKGEERGEEQQEAKKGASSGARQQPKYNPLGCNSCAQTKTGRAAAGWVGTKHTLRLKREGRKQRLLLSITPLATQRSPPPQPNPGCPPPSPPPTVAQHTQQNPHPPLDGGELGAQRVHDRPQVVPHRHGRVGHGARHPRDLLGVVRDLGLRELEPVRGAHDDGAVRRRDHAALPQLGQRGERDACVRAVEHAGAVGARGGVHQLLLRRLLDDAVCVGQREDGAVDGDGVADLDRAGKGGPGLDGLVGLPAVLEGGVEGVGVGGLGGCGVWVGGWVGVRGLVRKAKRRAVCCVAWWHAVYWSSCCC